MGEVYRHSFLILSTNIAENQDSGIWPPDRPEKLPQDTRKIRVIVGLSEEDLFVHRFPVPRGKQYNSKTKSAFCRSTAHGTCGLLDGYLQDRGWTFQELVMSRGVVHFTATELIWRYNTEAMCQCGIPTRSKSPKERFFAAVTNPESSQLLMSLDWTKMISEYSSRNFERQAPSLVRHLPIDRL